MHVRLHYLKYIQEITQLTSRSNTTPIMVTQYSSSGDEHLHVRRIVVTSAAVAAAKHGRDGHSRAELGGKGSASALGSGARVVVLVKLDVAGALVGGAPDGPAGRVDDAAHGRVLEGDAGVGAPGAAQVVGAAADRVARGGGNVAVVEDVDGGSRVRGASVGYCRN